MSSGASWRHGPHQDAQTLMKTGLPRNSASVSRLPVRSSGPATGRSGAVPVSDGPSETSFGVPLPSRVRPTIRAPATTAAADEPATIFQCRLSGLTSVTETVNSTRRDHSPMSTVPEACDLTSSSTGSP